MFVLSRLKTVSLLFVAAALCGGCAGSKSRLKVGQAPGGEVVEAVGYAPYNPKDLLLTKQASLADAQRKAVENVVGVFVSAKTLVEKSVSIENNILSRTEGYVKKYDVLSEGPEGELYKTKIRALVALKDLEADLKSMALLKEPELQRPRVQVVLIEQIERQDIKDNPGARALENALQTNGYVVVGPEKASEAELVFRGKASAFPFQDEGLGGFVSYRARIDLQVERPGTKDILLSYSKEASGLGGNNDLAGMKALEAVGNLAGTELAEQVANAWGNSKNLIIYVEGVDSFEKADKVKKHLVSQPGIKDVILRMYDEGMAQFEVQLGDIRATDLAVQLSKSQTVPLQVVETQPQLLRLKLQ